MIKSYNSFVNESIRDKMIGKTEDDVLESVKRSNYLNFIKSLFKIIKDFNRKNYLEKIFNDNVFWINPLYFLKRKDVIEYLEFIIPKIEDNDLVKWIINHKNIKSRLNNIYIHVINKYKLENTSETIKYEEPFISLFEKLKPVYIEKENKITFVDDEGHPILGYQKKNDKSLFTLNVNLNYYLDKSIYNKRFSHYIKHLIITKLFEKYFGYSVEKINKERVYI